MAINKQKNFDCVAAAEHLHEYLDGELQSEIRVAMEQHLAMCADCAKTLAQLRQLESAQQLLDAQLPPPSEEYWQALPQRVMERVKASEKRRLLALPRLPRLKSSIRTPAAETTPQRDLLYLSPAVRKFLNSPAKYVLPLAAVVTFCFFMIRELREKTEAPIMTASTPQSELKMAQSEGAKEQALEKPAASTSEQIAKAPPQNSPAGLRTFQPRAGEKMALPQDTLLAIVSQAAGRGQGAGLASTTATGQSLGASTPATVALKMEEPKPVVPMEAQPQTPNVITPESKQTQTFVVSSSKAKDQPAPQEILSKAEPRADSKTEIESRLSEEQLAQSKDDETRARKSSSGGGRMGVSAMATGSALNSADQLYNEAVQRAQQTSDLKKREKIWRDFLKANPNSSSRALATVALARTLAAASDSTTKPEQLEKNITFFHENSTILRAQMGADTYDREIARLQMLLSSRQSKSKSK